MHTEFWYTKFKRWFKCITLKFKYIQFWVPVLQFCSVFASWLILTSDSILFIIFALINAKTHPQLPPHFICLLSLGRSQLGEKHSHTDGTRQPDAVCCTGTVVFVRIEGWPSLQGGWQEDMPGPYWESTWVAGPGCWPGTPVWGTHTADLIQKILGTRGALLFYDRCCYIACFMLPWIIQLWVLR